MTLKQVWDRFRAAQPGFIASYVAYHYFRSRGWIPKSGLKFGVDYGLAARCAPHRRTSRARRSDPQHAPPVLYKQGPAFYHSSYAVVVRSVDAETLEPALSDPGVAADAPYRDRVLDWPLIVTLGRLSEQVAKVRQAVCMA